MKTRLMNMLLLSLLMLSAFSTAPASDRVVTDRWDFNVFLDDKKVGKHLFEVNDLGGIRQVQSVASFKYTILLIPAYRYDHNNAERWSDNCLLDFEARTNANGKRISVSGVKEGSNFIVDTDGTQVELPACVMTFAYWNPDFLAQSKLLNPQTGEYLDVTVEQIRSEQMDVRGEQVAAVRYRLTAKDVDISLWYSLDRQWLALESLAKGGRVIRYELS